MQFNEYVKIREEKFGSVIFETLREKIFVTNETGRDILRLLEEEHSFEKIVDILSNIYSADTAEIKNDVNSFINQLKDKGIIANSIEQRA